jgi:hypothetical protein
MFGPIPCDDQRAMLVDRWTGKAGRGGPPHGLSSLYPMFGAGLYKPCIIAGND